MLGNLAHLSEAHFRDLKTGDLPKRLTCSMRSLRRQSAWGVCLAHWSHRLCPALRGGSENGPQGEEVGGKGECGHWPGKARPAPRGAWRLEGQAKERDQLFKGSRESAPGGFSAGCLGHDPHRSESVSPTEKGILVMMK